MQPQEYIIWRSTLREQWRKYLLGLTIFFGFLFGAMAFAGASMSGNSAMAPAAFVGGFLIIGGPGIFGYWLSGKLYDYVVTNQRAMLRRFGKVVKEVSLNTPNLVISTGEEEAYAHGGGLFNRSVTSFHHVDIVFVANGVELLRFKKVDAGKANELFAKLRSMGFNVT